MKNIAFITALVLISAQSFSQVNHDKNFYEQKVIKYTNMKKGGTFLTIAGGILGTVGIITLANSSISTYEDGNGYTETTTEGNPGLGAACFLLGLGGVGAGIPLWVVGSKSQRKYEAKLQSFSLRLNANPNNAGFAFAYRF